MADAIAQRERTANRLGLAEQMAAARWLESMKEEAARIPQTQLAKMLAARLERPVTVGNLGTIAEACGVKLHGFSPSMDWARTAELLREAMADLQMRLEVLECRYLAERSIGAQQPMIHEIAGKGVAP